MAKLNKNDPLIKLFNKAKFQIIQNNTLYAIFSLREIEEQSKKMFFYSKLRDFINENTHLKIDFLNNEKLSKSFNDFLLKTNLYKIIDLIDIEILNKNNPLKGKFINFENSLIEKIYDNRIYSHYPQFIKSNWAFDFLKSGFEIEFIETKKGFILNDSSIDLFYTLLMNDYGSVLKNNIYDFKHLENKDNYNLQKYELDKRNNDKLINILKTKKVVAYQPTNEKEYFKSSNNTRMQMDLIDYFILATQCIENKNIKTNDINSIFEIKKIISNKNNYLIRELLSWAIRKILSSDLSYKTNENIYSYLANVILDDRITIDNVEDKICIFIDIINFINSICKHKNIYIKNNYLLTKLNVETIILFIIENRKWKDSINEYIESIIKSDILNETFNKYVYIDTRDILSKHLRFKKNTKINKIRLIDNRINLEIFNHPIFWQSLEMKMKINNAVNLLIINKKISNEEIKKIRENEYSISLIYEKSIGTNYFNFKNYALIKTKNDNNLYYKEQSKIFFDEDSHIFYDKESIVREIDENDLMIKSTFLNEVKNELKADKKYIHYQSIPAIINAFIEKESIEKYKSRDKRVDFGKTWSHILENSNQIFTEIYNKIIFPESEYMFIDIVNENYKFLEKIIEIKFHEW